MSVRAVMVTGAGGAFCSGGDTGWIGGDPDASVAELRDKMLPFYRTWLSIRELEVPTMAAIDGAAIGAGAALALACDVRVASPRALFAVPFLRLGIHPGMGTTMLLRSVAGDAVARDLLLTGRRIGSAGCSRMGLVTDVLDQEDFVAAACDRAALLAAGAPIATRLTTVALRRRPTSLAEALDWEALAQPITMATEDLHEGLAAQRERRRPDSGAASRPRAGSGSGSCAAASAFPLRLPRDGRRTPTWRTWWVAARLTTLVPGLAVREGRRLRPRSPPAPHPCG